MMVVTILMYDDSSCDDNGGSDHGDVVRTTMIWVMVMTMRMVTRSLILVMIVIMIMMMIVMVIMLMMRFASSIYSFVIAIALREAQTNKQFEILYFHFSDFFSFCRIELQVLQRRTPNSKQNCVERYCSTYSTVACMVLWQVWYCGMYGTVASMVLCQVLL